MKAVVLAAGKGTRLGAVANSVAKPMLVVGGRPVIGHVLEVLAKCGVHDVFMNLHHQADIIRGYCGDGSRWGFRITYAVESELLGTAGALTSFASHLMDTPFFVAYGDNYFQCDPAELWEFHHARTSLATLALFEKTDVTGSGVVEIDEDGRVLTFVEKPRPGEAPSRLVNGGLYVLAPRILPLIPDRIPCDFGYDIFPALMAAGYAMHGLVMRGSVGAIDTPELYQALRKQAGDAES